MDYDTHPRLWTLIELVAAYGWPALALVLPLCGLGLGLTVGLIVGALA